MPQEIHVPSGEAGDEAVMRIIPNLHKMARGERNDNQCDTNG